ncbi:golgin subfamily a member 7 erf4 protein, partial [Pyrenophora tritici-repentis]
MASTQDARDSASPVQHNDKDVEAGRNQQSAVSRVSLPTSQRSSMGSHDDQGDDDDGASEFPWGPSHPCFPHPNPHVPLDSELYNTTRIIRIKRDWMMKGDLAPTFANLYPEILDPLILEDDFRTLIKHINDTLIAAFDPFTFRACLDTVMGVATFWLWEDAGLTGVKKQLVALERWIEDWNRDVGVKEAVRIIPLRRTGYLTARALKRKKTKSSLTSTTIKEYNTYRTPLHLLYRLILNPHLSERIHSKQAFTDKATNKNEQQEAELNRYRYIFQGHDM